MKVIILYTYESSSCKILKCKVLLIDRREGPLVGVISFPRYHDELSDLLTLCNVLPASSVKSVSSVSVGIILNVNTFLFRYFCQLTQFVYFSFHHSFK